MMPRPPARWTALLRWLTPAADRDAVLGDLLEGYARRHATDGRRAAQRWCRAQVLASLGPLVTRRLAPAPSPKGSPMNGLWQDIRFSTRAARSRPLVTTVAVLSLAVGITLPTVVFNLLDAAVLRPLAVTDPDELSLITEQRATSVNSNLPYPDFVDWSRDQQAFSGMLASSPIQASVAVQQSTIVVTGEAVSGGYFETLGVPARRGRTLAPSDDLASSAPVAVVSERVWAQVAGATAPFSPTPITVNQRPLTVVGVIDDRFAGVRPGARAGIWVPLTAMQSIDPDRIPRLLAERRASWLWLLGRRRPGVTHEAAAAELNRVEAGLAPTVGRSAPKQLRVTDGRRGTDTVPDATRDTLRILLGASLLVLLVACANVAHLLTAQSTERRRELQVRAALGAGRWRLVRLLVVDAGLTAALAGVLGLAAMVPAARLASSMIAVFGTPMDLSVGLDWRTALFALALGTAAALAASVAPAWHVFRAAGAAAPQGGARTMTSGRATLRFRQALLVGQFALALALMVAAALLLRTVAQLRALPAGFDTDRVALLTVDTAAASLTASQREAYLRDAAVRLAAVPGVEAVGLARVIPVGFGGSRMTVVVPEYTPAADEDMELNYNLVGGDYFAAMGINLVDGRPFQPEDAGRAVAIINETMARRYWPDGQAVGREMFAGSPDPVTIIGIARDAKYRMLREEPRPSFYVPLTPDALRGGVFHVRTARAPEAALPELRRALTEVSRTVPVTDARTLRSQTEANITDDRVAMTIGVSLAGAAVLLAAVGLFGAMTYQVSRRTREMGIRVALGAAPPRLLSLVLRQGLTLALMGGAAGLVLSVWTTGAIEARLFRVSAFDTWSFGLALALLTAIALAATVLPARRAARVDPMVALRDD